MNDSERRITELDGIRGLAALGVVVYHYHRHFEAAPWDALLFPIYRGGLLFVDLFFVLSGFILAQVYSHEARYPTLRSAVVSRIARLYPLHLLTLAAVGALQKLHVILTDHCFIYVYNDWYHLALNLFMLNESGLQRGFSFNGPSWSISTEFIVNVLFLAVALRSPKRAMMLGLALIAGMIALNAVVGWTEPPRYLEPFSRLFRCFLSFGAGLVLRGVHERARMKRLPGWLVEGALVAAIGAMLYLMARPERTATYYALALVVFPAIVLLSLRSRFVGGALRTRPIVHLGHISFSVYLLHYPLELFYKDLIALTGFRPPFENVVMLALVAVLCVAVSHVTWKYFEMPARKWLKNALT
ncbi:MAG: acyltransferase [Candidatus Hydrogenedentes bacterium]|nr:acyltransferase [Candidatus Hydrogenedentota bacterium]